MHNHTTWDHNKETLDEWLKRERKATRRVENPTCPHCDEVNELHELEYPDGLVSYFGGDDVVTVSCMYCSKDFYAMERVERNYTTGKTVDEALKQ